MCLFGFFVYQLLDAGSSLQQAAYDIRVVSQNLSDGRTEAAKRNLALAQERADSARGRTSGPLVWLGSKVPVVGDDVSAIRTATQVLDNLASDTLPLMVEASRGLSPASLKPRNGRIAIPPIKRAAPLLAAAADDLEAASDRVSAIETDELLAKLRSPMARFQAQLAEAARLGRRGASAAELLPAMLGDAGPRYYGLITQNNAEIRATGGIPGAVSIIRADKGELRIVEQDNEGGFGFDRQQPVLPLTSEEEALYGKTMGIFPQSVNLTPDFPRSAQLLHAMWEERRGRSLDGILSIDPVAMSYVLTATGSLPFPGGRVLDAATLVRGLENFVYVAVPDYAAQDDFFADVGRTIFSAVVAGKGSPAALLDVVSRSIDEGRVYVWSAHEDEEELLRPTPLGGGAPEPGSERPQLGVYLNDALSDKMSFYLAYTVDVTPRSCSSRRSQVLEVKIAMKSTAPLDIKKYVRQLVAPGHPVELEGIIRTSIYLYAPFEGRIFGARLDGAEAPLGEFTHLDREVQAIALDLKPQQSRELTFSVRTGDGQPGPVELETSPAALGSGRGLIGPSACN